MNCIKTTHYVEFTTKYGERKFGRIINEYMAFEGGKRFVIKTDMDEEYRCVLNDGVYVEYVI